MCLLSKLHQVESLMLGGIFRASFKLNIWGPPSISSDVRSAAVCKCQQVNGPFGAW